MKTYDAISNAVRNGNITIDEGIELIRDLLVAEMANSSDDDEKESYPCEECGYDARDCGCPQFADPGSNSALRAATAHNPRIYPCPTCGRKKMLTIEDKALGYQCDYCADIAERGGY